jgi:carbon monoxide dehydrogenase subunit G
MTVIESDKAIVNATAEDIFTFLCDFNNFEQLMPDQVSGWESTEDSCLFTIQGMAKIGMKISEKIANTEVKIVSTDKSPFKFDLNCKIGDQGDGTCEAQMILEADFNPMIQLMVEKPLGNLFSFIVRKLQSTHQ